MDALLPAGLVLRLLGTGRRLLLLPRRSKSILLLLSVTFPADTVRNKLVGVIGDLKSALGIEDFASALGVLLLPPFPGAAADCGRTPGVYFSTFMASRSCFAKAAWRCI